MSQLVWGLRTNPGLMEEHWALLTTEPSLYLPCFVKQGLTLKPNLAWNMPQTPSNPLASAPLEMTLPEGATMTSYGSFVFVLNVLRQGLSMFSRLAPNLPSSWLHLPNVETTGVCHHAKHENFRYKQRHQPKYRLEI